MIKPGDIVLVMGTLDSRIREKLNTGPVYGTVDQLLVDNQVCVILENNDLWTGQIREVQKS